MSERECEAAVVYLARLLPEMRIPAHHATEDARRSEALTTAVRQGFDLWIARVVADRIG